MAGHNKWSKARRLKGALVQIRGKLSKLAKEFAFAANEGAHVGAREESGDIQTVRGCFVAPKGVFARIAR